MDRFRILSIRTKLVIGFGTIIVLLAVVSVMAYVGLTSNLASQRALYEENFGNVYDLVRLRANLNAERLDVAVMVEPSPSHWGPWQADIQQCMVKEAEGMRDLRARLRNDPEAFGKLSELRALLADFQETRDRQELRLIQEGKLEEARKLFAGIQLERLTKMRAIARELEDREVADARRMVAEAEAKARSNITWFAILGVAAVLVAAALAVHLNKTVVAYIKERGRAEKEVRMASLYTRSLIEASLDPLVTISADGKITDVNKATEEVTGIQRDKLIGSDFSNYFTEPGKAQQGYQQVLAQGFVRDYPLAILDLRGKVTDVIYNAALYRNEAGEVQGVFAAARDITERKRAEEALRKSAEEIEDLYNRAPIGYHSVNKDGTFVRINDTELAWLGYTRDEVVGRMTFADLLTAGSLAAFRETFEESKARGWVSDLEYDMIRKDGTILPVLLSATAVRDAQGNFVMSRSTIYDITERRKLEAKLKQISAYTRSLIEASLDPLVTISAEGKIMDVNQATERVTGFPRERLIGSDFSDYFTEPEKARQGYQQVLAEGFVRDYPLAIRHESGAVTDVIYNATVFRNEAGELQGVFAAARDITERKKAEKALRESQKLLADICDAIPAVVAYVDADQRYRFVNKTVESWFGCPRTEIVGRHISNVLGDSAYGHVHSHVQQALSGQQIVHEDWVRYKDAGLRYVCRTYIPHFAESGEVNGFLAVATDATDAKQAEMNRLAKEKALRETLVREVHHRIKNNLQGVAGLLRQHIARHPHLAEAIESAISQINSIAVVHGLQSQSPSGEVVLWDMTASIGRAIQSMTQQPIEVAIRGEAAEALWVRKEEAVPLALVLNELVCNAVKHGGKGADPAVRVVLDGNPKEAVIRISNARAQLPPAFDFAAGRGLSTGLNLVRSLLPMRGADLTFVQENEGVLVELRISPPVVLERTDESKAAQADEPEPALTC